MSTDESQDGIQILPWEHFEEEVYTHVQAKINSYKFLLIPESVTIERRKAYYSKDRADSIIFDIAIEAFMKGTKTPSLIWIWECKDYPSRQVSVDEVEEFYAKLQQIGIGKVKGTIVTRLGFQSGAVSFAQSNGIGLAVLQKTLIAVTHFDEKSKPFKRLHITCPFCLTLLGKEISERFNGLDVLIQSELRRLGLLR